MILRQYNSYQLTDLYENSIVPFSNSVVWKVYLPSVKREKTVLSKCNTDNDIFTTRKIKRYIFYCILIKKGNYCAVAYVLKNKDKSTTFTYTIRSKYKYNNRIIVIPNSVIHLLNTTTNTFSLNNFIRLLTGYEGNSTFIVPMVPTIVRGNEESWYRGDNKSGITRISSL